MARREDVLRQLDLYRQGLGRHLRQVSDDIIDGEFSETEQRVAPDRRPRRWWAMTSTKKVAASRVNGRRSRGPRTGSGKARASRNARRHGLAAFNNKDPAMSGQIKQMVDAICQGDDDPLLRERAVAIAEAQLWLSCIRTEKVAVLERLRDPEEDALTERKSRRGRVKRCRKFNLNFRAFQIASAQLEQLEALML